MHRPSLRFSAPYFFCGLSLLSLAAIAEQADIAAPPKHLAQAEKLVDNLKGAQENVYGGGKRHIDWAPDECAARTVCSSFMTLLLQHTYGWTSDAFQDKMHSTNPEAGDYHDAIVDRRGFKQVRHMSALRPGDILAVKYTDHHVSSDGVEDTGHVMLVREAPVLMESKKPVIPGTQQYRVVIIDSSASGHGPTDTRAKPEGGFTGGIGSGTIRLYADASGEIEGYTWSNTTSSPYYTGPARDLVAGRLKFTDW
ncbi:hypothetical protein CCAX7_44810 [Capsulimonas corticalis]|uniref:Uncharacterized protein n=1 Tax=Capsulimonas corticalis TaxID=2219043 RepID=A0A402CX11_9BACT|nr:hypothetical protein [Capsulimonas corticalis]BDI32430.1 hypothetical protein CCAX7_44810 [Capsulimonas corticalis]